MARAPKPTTEELIEPVAPVLGVKFLSKQFVAANDEGGTPAHWSTRIQLEMGPQGSYAGPQDIDAPEDATDGDLKVEVAKAWGLATLDLIPADEAAE